MASAQRKIKKKVLDMNPLKFVFTFFSASPQPKKIKKKF